MLNPHLHVLVVDGVFQCTDDGASPRKPSGKGSGSGFKVTSSQASLFEDDDACPTCLEPYSGASARVPRTGGGAPAAPAPHAR